MIPKYIALCGAPKSGKSEVQKYLNEQYGILPIDDGRCLRLATTTIFNLGPDDCWTQEGKLKKVSAPLGEFEVRDILGSLGNWMEDKFGANILPQIALKDADHQMNKKGFARYHPACSFGSVRKEQGFYYKERGGIVIEVTRPGVEPSKYEFDRYSKDAVDFTINNDGSIDDLRDKVDLIINMFTQENIAA